MADEAEAGYEVAEILGNDRVDEFLFFLGAFLDLDFADSPFTKALEDDPREPRHIVTVWGVGYRFEPAA